MNRCTSCGGEALTAGFNHALGCPQTLTNRVTPASPLVSDETPREATKLDAIGRKLTKWTILPTAELASLFTVELPALLAELEVYHRGMGIAQRWLDNIEAEFRKRPDPNWDNEIDVEVIKRHRALLAQCASHQQTIDRLTAQNEAAMRVVSEALDELTEARSHRCR